VVSHTGVAGLTLGGGMGRLQRKHGLTIDNLLEVELVTAEGRLVRASEDENPELFWGLRGAGANFGIATSFTFRLSPLDAVITHGTVFHPVERARELAALFREAVETGPDELWASFGVGLAGGEPVATVSVHHCGPLDQAEQDLAALRAFGPPLDGSFDAKPYLEAQHLNDEAMEWGHRFYMKSAFLHSLPDELVDLAVEHVSRVPRGTDGGYSTWAWGGAIASVPEGATAFTGREANFWLAAEIQWDDPALDDSCREWGRAAMAGVSPFALAGRYVNDVAEADERATIASALAALTRATLVFDEIDAGIGGQTAHAVAQTLRRLGERSQVLTITHLSQIASVADRHLRVEKVPGDPTHTRIEQLAESERKDELQRMLGGREFLSTVR
jgi:FAD/FMN-containing dehydrogenase